MTRKPGPETEEAGAYDTVSLTERIETRRKSRARPWWVAAVVVVVLAGLAAAAWFTPLLALHKVQVTGATLSDEGEIETKVLADYRGVPLPQIRLGRLGRTLQHDNPKSQSVSVSWAGPRSLRIDVRDRVPRAAAKTTAGWVRYDADGRELDTVRKDPGLPVLRGSAHGADSVTAAVKVLDACSREQRERIDDINAGNTDQITLGYQYAPEPPSPTATPTASAASRQAESGRRQPERRVKIIVGDTSDIGRKMTIALRLAATGAHTVDVSVPTRPVTR